MNPLAPVTNALRGGSCSAIAVKLVVLVRPSEAMAVSVRGGAPPKAIAYALAAAALAAVLPLDATAEQASQPASAEAGRLDLGQNHSCATVPGEGLRCWGFGREGELGYGNRLTVGDDETPGSVAPVDFGAGRLATAVSSGDFHTCALLDDGNVRCWGFAANGRLGHEALANVGDDESPGTLAPVDLGDGRTATAVTAGNSHTCAILDDGGVRCWGYAYHGELGYALAGPDGAQEDIGDDEAPGSVGPVQLGAGRTAVAIAAGDLHTCALLDDGSVRCWGLGSSGQLGYGNTRNVGDDELPGSVGPVFLGVGRTAVAIAAGVAQTCAILDDGGVRCWGFGRNGRLGYGSAASVGDDELPGSLPPVDLGPGREAVAIGVGDGHACALLDDGSVRCWGDAASGRLGYGRAEDVGDDEAPGSVGPVALGAGRTAVAIALGAAHTCARLEGGGVRCWGYGGNGRLGLCGARTIGDDELPAAVGTVALSGAARCPPAPPAPRAVDRPATAPDPLAAEASRRRAMRACLASATRHARSEVRRARRLGGRRRARAMRHARRHRLLLRRRCTVRHGRIPGRVTGLRARPVSARAVVLNFRAPGTDGSRAPAARGYLVRQSRRPMRDARAFRRGQTLCSGSCRFGGLRTVGERVALTVEDLRPRTDYYYAVAARDNVSHRLGPRSRTVRVRTR